MTYAIALGVLTGLGILLLVYGATAGRQTLLNQVLAVDAAVPQRSFGPTDTSLNGSIQRAVSRLVNNNPALARLIGADLASDLRMMGMDPSSHLVYKIALALVGFVAAPTALASLALLVGFPVPYGLIAGLFIALVLFLIPDSNVRKAATERRRDFIASLASYLDLVALRAASGSGVSESLREASTIGAGYGWRSIRSALNDARFAGKSPAAGLETLGRDLDIVELVELSTQLALVDETGAQTESTLRAKADALRARSRSEMEGDANARSTTMVLGQALFAIGFLILLGFPAMMMVAAI